MKKRIATSIVAIFIVAVLVLCFVGCATNSSQEGASGLSAYEIAKKNGFSGTEQEWLASLSASKSAYDLAVEQGFVGTLDEWLASLQGANGRDGQDADITIEDVYQAAVEAGYEGTFLEFVKEYLDDTTLTAVSTEVIANQAVLSVVSVYANFTKTYSYTSVWPYCGQSGSGTTTQGYASAGSGVFYYIDSEKGDAYIITNYHVVYDADSDTANHISDDVFVLLYGNNYLSLDSNNHVSSTYAIPATYIGGSMTYDIAVLKVTGSERLKAANGSTATAVEIGNSNYVTVGSKALAVGNPEGLGISVTEGIISVDSESISLTAADSRSTISVRVMRVDTAINSGNSGGGLFDASGKLIGIVNAKASSSDIDNIAYAIPSNVAKYVADGIIERYESTGSVQPVQKCMLGVTVSAADSHAIYDEETSRTHIKEDVTVISITSGGLADGKLQAGDILKTIEVRGTTLEIDRTYVLVDAMLLSRVGDEVKLAFTRDGVDMEVTFTITAGSVTIIS